MPQVLRPLLLIHGPLLLVHHLLLQPFNDLRLPNFDLKPPRRPGKEVIDETPENRGRGVDVVVLELSQVEPVHFSYIYNSWKIYVPRYDRRNPLRYSFVFNGDDRLLRFEHPLFLHEWYSISLSDPVLLSSLVVLLLCTHLPKHGPRGY